jgi:cytochrome c-type biogenesis protein CcmF
VVATSVGLLAWRGDLLRSPGSIASPLSREAAFLANNFLFGAFALVVLLGTVFPLLVQAVDGQQITVGAPYFDTMTMPIVVCILFLMAVAPVLPWRKATQGLVRSRLFWPAAVAVATLVAALIAGVRGLNPLLAFGLGAFAAASAVRQLAVELRRRGPAGITGPAGGGMVVHLGVVAIAVAFAASHSFAQQAQLTLSEGQTASFAGHTFTYLGTRSVATSTHTALEAVVRVDDAGTLTPAISDYPQESEGIGTPSVRSSFAEDVYLTLASTPARPGGPVAIGVIVEPLVEWIWAGGGVMLAGTLLCVWPRRRRRREETEPAPALAEPARVPA